MVREGGVLEFKVVGDKKKSKKGKIMWEIGIENIKLEFVSDISDIDRFNHLRHAIKK